jgi:hypothetical protein
MSALAELRSKVASGAFERAAKWGKVPRRAYVHYFIESEGLHSRIHLQNFYSTFWPQYDVPAMAHIRVHSADGSELGTHDVQIPRFGSMFLEARDLLGAIGAQTPEGTVSIDLQPAPQVRRDFGDLPEAATAQINTPFWMAYYDADENYMYVHSIERLDREFYGTLKPISWLLSRSPSTGEHWRSWRLLDREGLTDLQVVVINHGTAPGTTRIGIYSRDDSETLFERELELKPRQLERVVVPSDEIDSWPERPEHVRIGLDPLLTANGKPYVLMRYSGGPLSIHHG